MNIVENKIPAKKSKKKKSAPDYSSWDPLTQVKYLYDLGKATGENIAMTDAYKVAIKATLEDSN